MVEVSPKGIWAMKKTKKELEAEKKALEALLAGRDPEPESDYDDDDGMDMMPIPASVSPASTMALPRARTLRRSRITLYDKIADSLAHLGALAFAALLWWVGAQFTLSFFGSLGANLAALGLAQWLIPLSITMIEVRYWPSRTSDRQQKSLFTFVAGVDLITTAIGGVAWLTNRSIAGWTVPQNMYLLWLIGGILAAGCAFWPEKLGRSAIRSLRSVWA